ncbi:hypothetical protein NQ315_009581 [Exocentrus adspersus]|uniref:Odorant receptor n=1 Tax=Exocentrus adspersus TaxID=1586481 RepID=A0AAV8WGL7_9CUCU|nr:hypothetical protein NQ315_009581 [Exocentrus adspersus]
MVRHADYLGSLKIERVFLSAVGFYPSPTSKYKYLKNISGSFLFILTVLYIILALIHAFINLTDVAVLSENVTFLMTVIVYATKVVNLQVYRKNILLLEDLLTNPILTELEMQEEENIVKENLKSARFFTNIYKTMANIAVSVHVVSPLFDFKRTGYKHFIFLLWLPFDRNKHYGTVYFFEMVLLLSVTWFCITLDALNILMMNICAIQFEVLKNRLSRISKSFSRDDEVDDRIRMQKLREYIIQQNHVYRCSSLVQKTYSIGVFTQVVCSVLIVCFGLFKSIVTPLKSMQFMMLTSYSLTMIYQVSLYCVYGQKVLDASNDLTDACYMSKWNHCSLGVQKYLVMIMTRGNRPVIMKAGGIFDLTLETLMTIYTSSYSFFAIIWQVYNTEE